MKVVKEGSIVNPIWKGTCNRCKSEMEEMQSMLNIKCDDRPCATPYAEEECPVCSHTFTLRKD